MRDSGLQHSARIAALDAARDALEAKLRALGMFRLEVRAALDLKAHCMRRLIIHIPGFFIPIQRSFW
jgi:hypothetical protein